MLKVSEGTPSGSLPEPDSAWILLIYLHLSPLILNVILLCFVT